MQLSIQHIEKRGYSARFLRNIKVQTLKEITSGELVKPPCIPPEPIIDQFSKPCKHRFCPECILINEDYFVLSNTTKFKFKIRENLDCNSSNLIYLIECKNCHIQYIGQTKRSLRCRMHEHRGNIVNDRATAVAKHFNKVPCSIEDFSITAIFRCPKLESEDKTDKLRLKVEKYFIQAFKCFMPYGLNTPPKGDKDIPKIHFVTKYSNLGKTAAKIVRSHYSKLQEILPHIFYSEMVTGYSRNKNLKDLFVSAKIRN